MHRTRRDAWREPRIRLAVTRLKRYNVLTLQRLVSDTRAENFLLAIKQALFIMKLLRAERDSFLRQPAVSRLPVF